MEYCTGGKIHTAKDELWFQILKAKYFPDEEFRETTSQEGSQFWKSLHKVKHLFNWGACFSLNNGKSISFWKNVWIGEYPLKVQFNRLYEICADPDDSVSDCYAEGSMVS